MQNPGVTPTPGSPQYGRDKPQLGEGEMADPNKPFSLPPEAGKPTPEQIASDKPTPMDVASEEGGKQTQIPPEELSGQVEGLKNQLADAQAKIQDTAVTKNFTEDHGKALSMLAKKMTPDVRAIANNSGGRYQDIASMKGEGPLGFVGRWLNGSQETMTGALKFLSGQRGKQVNPAQYLKLQYAVQRATQRGELFASIIGSSVSGIKTIMSTQLG